MVTFVSCTGGKIYIGSVVHFLICSYCFKDSCPILQAVMPIPPVTKLPRLRNSLETDVQNSGAVMAKDLWNLWVFTASLV